MGYVNTESNNDRPEKQEGAITPWIVGNVNYSTDTQAMG